VDQGGTRRQQELVASDPERFFVPPYLGPKGWVRVWLDAGVGWDDRAELVTDGYRLAAPKRLEVLRSRDLAVAYAVMPGSRDYVPCTTPRSRGGAHRGCAPR
jgi:hypothetical protein